MSTDSSDVQSEILTGDRLQSVLSSLPDYVAQHVTSVVLVTLPSSDVDEAAPSGWWSTSVCENGHSVVYIGHEDPATMTSVFDGSVTTTIACSPG